MLKFGWIDGVAVTAGGTVSVTRNGNGEDADDWRVYRVAPCGKTDIVLRALPSTVPTVSPSTITAVLKVVNYGYSVVDAMAMEG